MKHLEQIKEIIQSEIGRFATVSNYELTKNDNSFEEYEVSFLKEFTPITIKAYSNGDMQVRVGSFYESISTIDSSCCYLYIALMNARR